VTTTTDTRFTFLRPKPVNLTATDSWTRAFQIVVGFLQATNRTVTLDTVGLELGEPAEEPQDEPQFPNLTPNAASFRERVQKFVERELDEQPFKEEEEFA
jgi:hypothetical protein